ncbi:hypothetical protein HDU84_004577 [Entophlyctis sp. JEL0112]|nr:hypothetical protein HDU84_004577 [Entophlyctis sp. JEL0112]
MGNSLRIYVIAVIACFGGLCFGFDTGIISGVLTFSAFKSYFGIPSSGDPNLSGNISGALQLGGLIGALIQPFANDYFGRKVSIQINSVVFLAGCFLQTFAPNIATLYVGRGIAGLGLSIISIAVALYNSEASPKNIRGRIVGIQQFAVGTGIAVAYWTNYAVARTLTGNIMWQLPLGLQVIPGCVLLIGMSFMPQSPRWLLMKGRKAEALKSLASIRSVAEEDEELLAELAEMEEFLARNATSTWYETFSGQNLKRVWVGATFIFFQQWTGQNMINYYSPLIFSAIGLNSNSTDLLATGVVGLVKMFMTLPALYVIDKVGRRPLMLFGTLLMWLSFYYIAAYQQIVPPASSSGEISGWGYLSIICVYIFMAGYAISWGPIHYVLPPEIYPQNIRAKTSMFGAILDWSFQFVGIKVSPLMIANIRGGGAFWIYGTFLFVFLVWIYVFLPETKGIMLEEMDVVFEDWRQWKKKVEVGPDGHVIRLHANTTVKESAKA